jgi:hypothetical protein
MPAGWAAKKTGKRAASAHACDGEDGTIKGQLDKAIREQDRQQYVLKLYVTGWNRLLGQTIERVRTVCEKHLHGRYELEVIDIYQKPALAKDEQIIATPTLI